MFTDSDSDDLCLIETLHSQDIFSGSSPIITAQARQQLMENLKSAVSSYTDVDILRQTLEFLLTYVPPTPVYTDDDDNNNNDDGNGDSGDGGDDNAALPPYGGIWFSFQIHSKN